MHVELYKMYYGDYKFTAEIDTGAEVGTHQVTLWFGEKDRDSRLRFLRAFYFEEANDDNIHTFCREFALYPDYRQEILGGQRHWTRRNALFVRNLYSVLGEHVLLADDTSFERKAREFFRWLDLHTEEIEALPTYQRLLSLDSMSDVTPLDPLIKPAIALLRQIPGVVPHFSCQGVSGKVRVQEYELMAVSLHLEYAYVSFETLSYFVHDTIVAQLPNFPHITRARIPCNFASEFHLRSTGDNKRFQAELMTLAQSILATMQTAQTTQEYERDLQATRWEAASYPERQPRIAAPGGVLPSRLAWLCESERIERTLHLLFHLNHWAKDSTSLFYVDRQGLYTIKATFVQQAFASGFLRPVTYIDGIATFARGFTIEMATDIAAEFLLDRLSLLFSKREHAASEDEYDRAARQLFQRISGRAATSASDLKTITQAEKYIRAALYALIEQARLTRQPIPYDELSALLIGPTDLLALPYNRERLVEFWHELDETNARKLDPEGNSLIAFQYNGAETRYTFHLPFRVAERFLPGEIVQRLQRHDGYSREMGIYYGRAITESESRAYPLPEILYELGINIDTICPRKLAHKEEIYTSHLGEHWEIGDEEEDDEYENEEYSSAARSGGSRRSRRAGRSKYRAQRHLQPTCPLCKCSVVDTVSARIVHWRQAHAGEDLTISQATWVLRQSEADLKAARLKPDYQAPDTRDGQGGTRYWKLSTLEIYAVERAVCL